MPGRWVVEACLLVACGYGLPAQYNDFYFFLRFIVPLGRQDWPIGKLTI